MAPLQNHDLANKIATLLRHDDPQQRRQGFELLSSLNDPDLFDQLLEGVAWSTNDGSLFYKSDPSIPRFKRFKKEILFELVARCPPSAKAAVLRNAPPYVSVSYLDPEATALLPVFESITRLKIHLVEGFDRLPETWSCPNMTSLSIDELLMNEDILRIHGLPNLTKLGISNVYMPTLDLSGCPSLQALIFSHTVNVVNLIGVEHLHNLKKVDLSGCKKLSEATLTQLINQPAFEIEARKIRGNRRSHNNDEKGAVEDWSIVIKHEPTADLFRKCAVSRSIIKDYAGAIADFTQALQLGVTEPQKCKTNRAICAQNLGDYDAAERDCLEVLFEHPLEIFTLQALGIIYSKAGREEDERKIYDRIVEVYPQTIDVGDYQAYRLEYESTAFNNRSDIHLRSGNVQAALEDAERAVASEPSDAIHLLTRAEALASMGDWTSAKSDAEACLGLGPSPDRASLAQHIIAQAKPHVRPSKVAREFAEALEAYAKDTTQGKAVAADLVSRLGQANVDALWGEVKYFPNGMVRSDQIYGILPARPYSDVKHLSILADFDRLLLAAAPVGSHGAEIAANIFSLWLGGPAVDMQSLVSLPKIEHLWLESVEINHPEALIKPTPLQSLGLVDVDPEEDIIQLLHAHPHLHTLRLRSVFSSTVESICTLRLPIRVLDIRGCKLSARTYQKLLNLPRLEQLFLPTDLDRKLVPASLLDKICN